MKVALVYDRVNKWGGAERILLVLHKIFKDAPLYTSLYNRENARWADVFDVKPSFLQQIPRASNSHEFLATFMPAAFESFSFDDYDLVISITSEAAKGVITKPGTLHISICLTPTRYLWSGYDDYFKDSFMKIFSSPAVSYLKKWDKTAANRPDYMIAISRAVHTRIKKYYNRDSYVIYPPLTLINKFAKEFFPPKIKPKSYFLLVSRLVPYKRIDLAIEACNKLSLPLKIVGVGRDLERLKSMSGKKIDFLGYLEDGELWWYYKNARALIFPGIEDFGLVMVEAQLAGIPVIAYRGGGAEEIIIENKTGVFFTEQKAESLFNILKNFDERLYNNKHCEVNAKRFLDVNFEKELKMFLKDKIKEYFKNFKSKNIYL